MLPLCRLLLPGKQVELEHYVAIIDIAGGTGCISEKSAGKEAVVGYDERRIFVYVPGQNEIGLHSQVSAHTQRGVIGQKIMTGGAEIQILEKS